MRIDGGHQNTRMQASSPEGARFGNSEFLKPSDSIIVAVQLCSIDGATVYTKNVHYQSQFQSETELLADFIYSVYFQAQSPEYDDH